MGEISKETKESTPYIFTFAIIICLVCSVSLSLVSEGLRPQKEINVELDIRKNILKAVSINVETAEVLTVFEEKIQEIVVDADGNIVEGKKPAEIQDGEEAYPVYILKEAGSVKGYCIPIIGKGLWSTLYGYIALESDAKTVKGITYYQHGETPGLGAEISTDWFQDNFKGKSIWDDEANELKPVAVVKGKVADKGMGDKAKYFVDGISGATITSNGVTEMVEREITKYEPYFSKIRQ